jgi:hypothetical protein
MNLATHRIEGWMHSTDGLDVSEKTQICYPYRESDRGSSHFVAKSNNILQRIFVCARRLDITLKLWVTYNRMIYSRHGLSMCASQWKTLVRRHWGLRMGEMRYDANRRKAQCFCVSTTMSVDCVILWVVAYCALVHRNRRFGRTFRLHLHYWSSRSLSTYETPTLTWWKACSRLLRKISIFT